LFETVLIIVAQQYYIVDQISIIDVFDRIFETNYSENNEV